MKKTYNPIYLEVYFETPEDIAEGAKQIVKSAEFKNLTKVDIYNRICAAIEEEKEECALFRLVYYGVDLVVDKKDYSKLLTTVQKLYEEEEDYLKCAEIKKIIDTL